MLDLLCHKYRQARFRCSVQILEHPVLANRAMCYQVQTKSGFVYEFLLHKYKGGLMQALWGIVATFGPGTLEEHKLGPLGSSYATGLGNSLEEAENILGGRPPKLKSSVEFFRMFDIAH